MFFLGNTFLSDGSTMNATVTDVSEINQMIIQNGIFDELFATNDIEYMYTTTIPSTWDYNTILHALFEDDLIAGNVNYTVEQVSSVKIKRREYGTYDWLTIFEIDIDTVDDFSFDLNDITCRSNTTYEYAIVPVIGGAEGNFDINTVECEFDGIFIVEKNQSYHTDFECEITEMQRNQQIGTINTIGRKYPYHIKNGLSNYNGGSAKGFFIEVDNTTCELQIDESFDYRKELMDFLVNGNPKLLKVSDGRIWLIMIVGNPTETPNGHRNFIITNFNWEETGDYEDQTDLYTANIIDVES